MRHWVLVMGLVGALAAQAAWNDPYPAGDAARNILYSAFNERPKHLDPARAYSSNEYDFISQIYEPPFQYHYLKRPYVLVPQTAETVPHPVYLDRAGRRLPADAPAEQVAVSIYDIRIRPGIRYQPHPAFARGPNGQPRYLPLPPELRAHMRSLADFPETGTRELTAADYVHQIKRLAHPRLHSPLASVMSEHIVGFRDYGATLAQAQQQLEREAGKDAFLDLTRYPLKGVTEVDRYTYRISVAGRYPQFLYWMAMPFFAPMPPEADRFFSQPGMAGRNLTLDWYAVGTGPYMLTVNDPNRRMVLDRNPNYHDERYPAEGEPGDAEAGVLADAGRSLPFVDRAVFSLEKENIPYWNKFLQGYYDRSGISAESFGQAIQLGAGGEAALTESMRAQGIQLLTSVAASSFYYGFNMLDPVVGGLDERGRKLRQALSIAIDSEESIAIFRNGRGIAAQGPIPPGIYGYQEGCAGLNSYVYDCVHGQPQRKPIEAARRLLAEAGYPDGRDAGSGAQLLLYFDTPSAGPDAKAMLDWMRKQFQKLGIQMVERATDYNRFQDKMRKGNAQIFGWGWNVDYPDPENLLFLLYGPNKKVGGDGENASNYDNPEFNRLFERMKSMDNGPERAAIIARMVEIARRDAPWIWGMHPKQFSLQHAWVHNIKPNNLANNTLKYVRIDPALRARLRQEWNRPQLWPLGVLVALVVALVVPAVIGYRRRERSSAL